MYKAWWCTGEEKGIRKKKKQIVSFVVQQQQQQQDNTVYVLPPFKDTDFVGPNLNIGTTIRVQSSRVTKTGDFVTFEYTYFFFISEPVWICNEMHFS